MRRAAEQGSVLAIVAISLTVLLGIAALAIDLGGFRAHRRQLQTAADAAALAGAMQLPPFSDGSRACSRADYYARRNSALTSPQNMIVNANLDTSYCEVLANSVRVKPRESGVPYVFGRVLGFVNTAIDARARARVVYLTRSNGLLPFGVEDLRPKTVSVFMGSDPNAPIQSWGMAFAGCQAPTPAGYPYWCTANTVHANSVPPGGAPMGIRVVDNTGKVVDWTYIGWMGAPQTIAGTTCGASACQVIGATLNPATAPYYYQTASGSVNVQIRLSATLANSAHVQILEDGSTCGNDATSLGNGWYQASCPLSTSETTTGQAFTIRVGNKKTSPTSTTVFTTYAHDAGDILQDYTQTVHFLPTTGGDFHAEAAFLVLVKGKLTTLKLGGGGAQGNQGNYQGLDLDTNTSWPVYACYANGGVPNTADEIQHGACTPYSLGDPVTTQTGNFAGQVVKGLDARIGSSPNAWTSSANPPPPGDPRWMSLILVPPVTYANCNGTCTTVVVGFGSFYVTDYGGSKNFSSSLKPGEVSGVFWDRPVSINQYSTNCTDPQGICLASVALMPWDG